MVLEKLIKAHKDAFLSQDNQKYFFDLKFQHLNNKVIYAHKFFLFSISPEFRLLVNFDQPFDSPPQPIKGTFKALLDQCYSDSVKWDSDSKAFVTLEKGSRKAKENYEIVAKKRYELFLGQDKEKGFFDVAFKFKDGRILYAHKFMLTCLSPVFQTMFTENWDKDECIDIIFNTYNEFKTMLKFFYLGKYNFKENATLLFDFAECYTVLMLKTDLKEKMKITVENVFECSELAHFYNLNMDEKLGDLFEKFAFKLLTSEKFMETNIEFILFLVKSKKLDVTEETLFTYILIWAKNQCKNCETASKKHEEMRKKLVKVFPYIRFAIMDSKFVNQLLSDYDLLFTPEERNAMLQDISTLKKRNLLENKFNRNRSFRLIQIKDKRGNYLINEMICVNQNLWKQIFNLGKVKSMKGEDGIYWKHNKMLAKNYKVDKCFIVGGNSYTLVINEKGVLYLKDGYEDISDFVVASFDKIPCFIFDEGCIVRVF